MAVPTQLSDLSATAASNSPAGGDTVGTTMDDFIRAHASIIARISAGTDALATPNIGAATGTSLALGGGTALTTTNRTGTGNLVLATAPTLTGLTVSGAAFNSRGITDNATAKALTLSGSGANSVTIANSATNPTIGTSAGSLLFTPAGLQTLVLIAPASAVNYVSIVSQVTGNGPSINATGFDADVPLYLTSKGSQSIFLSTNGGAAAQVAILDTASANRYITLTGSNGGNPTIGTSAGQLTLGTGSALATSATEGYVCIPTCAGAPTGVPTGAGAGNLPLIYDTTNNKLYAYNGAWKATAALT